MARAPVSNTTLGGLVVLLLAGSAGLLAAQAAGPDRLALGGPPPVVRTQAQLIRFLDELEAQELALYEASSLESYYQWKGETHHYAAPFGRLIADLQTRRDYAAVIERWRGKTSDSTLARRLELLHRDFLVSRADPRMAVALVDQQTAVQDTLTAFRFNVRGMKLTRTALGELADTSPDRSLREAAFRAAPQLSSHLRQPILRAMTLTDRIGRAEGFANGAAAGLTLSSLEPGQVIRDLDAFEQSTRPAYGALLERARRDLGVERLEPWDIDYWLHRQEESAGSDAWPKAEGLTRLRGLMRSIGFAVDSLPIDVKVWDVPTGGITFPIRPPFEARLLTNPFTGSNFYETLFHEYGHAANAVLTRPDLPASFLRGDETPLGEGTAETLGHLAYDRHWLERAAHQPADRAAALERVGKMELLLWIRRTIALNAYVEISHYLRPGADLDSLFAASYRRFVGVTLPAGDFVGGRDMFATGPLYFQSYLYANMIAAQLREAMRAQFGVEDLTREPRVAGWLTKYFYAPGASIPWPEKIRRATGKALSTAALTRYLAGAGGAGAP
jgi:peptidyl-dipeptidase A